MSLLDAPEFNESKERRNRNLLVGSGILVATLAVLSVAGFAMGHGWLFMNLPVEHKVSVFMETLQGGDYAKAYGLFNNDADWQQHPQKYEADYPLKRFTEDFSSASDWKVPVTSYKVNCSKRDASGTAVNVTVNGRTPLTLKYQRSNGTLSFFPYELSCGIA